MFDHVIRGGDVIDGTGTAPQRLDVGIVDGRIAEIGPELGPGVTETDATDCIVTPGFVDVHTHYDGQVSWDDALEPSTPHGVTTVVMGNCGVGFAPVRSHDHDELIRLMEGVEDIPGAALQEGLDWSWESFPEYLDALDGRPYAIDVAPQLPHGALRLYVMGQRGSANEPANADDVASMAALAREAMEAGAWGFTTSRTIGHVSSDGVPVPGTFAAFDELSTIAEAVASVGPRNFEVAPSGVTGLDDNSIADHEFDWMGTIGRIDDLTVSGIVLQAHDNPDRWRAQLEQSHAHREAGSSVVPLIAARPFGVLVGWDARNPFRMRPSYMEIADLPLADRVHELAKAARRDAILSETDRHLEGFDGLFHAYLAGTVGESFVLGNPPDYEPGPDRQVATIAADRGQSLEATAYELMLGDDGTAILMRALFNYVDGDHAVLHEQLADPDAVVGLNDAGAHAGSICDASIPTYMLTHWARDRTRGPRLELSEAIRRLTSQPAELYGFADRGRLATGLQADVNVIDHENLQLRPPHGSRDLPAGGLRMLQDAVGYRMTMKNGTIIRRDGVDTGARPGRMLRKT